MGAGITPDHGPGHDPGPEAGFSLIELMIVVTVLSILSLSAGLAISFGRTDSIAGDDAARFLNTFNRLQAAAIHSRNPRGIVVQASGWRVTEFDPATGHWGQAGPEISWRGVAHFQTRVRAISAGLYRTPEVILLPDGRTTAFEVRFTNKDTFSNCSNDGWTGVKCDLP